MRCDEVMKTRVEFAREDETAQVAAKRMFDRNVGFLPVCDAAGRPIGTLTDRDLAMRIVAQGNPSDVPVSDVMTREVVTCLGTADLDEVEQLMGKHHKARIMVCDPQGRLAGVVSLSDLAERDLGGAARTLREVSHREARA